MKKNIKVNFKVPGKVNVTARDYHGSNFFILCFFTFKMIREVNKKVGDN